jgi:hypothetical protein
MSPIDLTTLAALKAWLPDLASITAYDDLLSGLITAASQFVCTVTGRATFAVASYQETYDSGGNRFLLLRQWPVVEVSTIVIEGGPPVADWRLEQALPAGGAQRLFLPRGVFPRGRGNIQITYDAGYATPPPAIAQAVIELAGERFKARDHVGQTAKTLGGQETTSFSTQDMNATIAALIAPYRRVI